MLTLLFTSSSFQAQGQMRVRNDGHSQIGYNANINGLNNTHKCLTFGNSGLTPNNGAWGMCHLRNSLNFFHMNGNNVADIDRLTINDGGVVGINCNINSQYFVVAPIFHRLVIQGNTIGFGFGSFSDIRLKENIVNLDSSSLTKLLSLNAVSYNYKIGVRINSPNFDSTSIDSSLNAQINAQTSNPHTDSVLHFGLIAQEVKTIFPNLVSESDNSVLSLNYTELIPVLIKAIQEQQKQILDQNAEIQLLKNAAPTTVTNPTSRSILYQNDPNPFNASTTFYYYIDEQGSISNCSIEIRDLTGILKATMTLADQSGLGQVTYNNNTSSNSSNSPLSYGYYVYTLKVNGSAKDSKMLLIE